MLHFQAVFYCYHSCQTLEILLLDVTEFRMVRLDKVREGWAISYYTKDPYGHLSLKVPNVEIDFDVSFST